MTSGFNPGPRVRRIEFDDTTPFPGLVIRVGGLTLDEWVGLGRVSDAADLFAERLVEWNWENSDGAVPPTREGFGQLDVSDARTLIASWVDNVAEVRRDPLAGAAGNGTGPPPDPELEAGMPMGPPSNAGTG